MKIALLDIKVGTGINSKFTALNMRNMLILERELNADFYYSTYQLNNNNKQYDVIIFGFGSIASEINKTKKFVKNSGAQNIFWLVGEYEQRMNPPLYYACKENNLKFKTIQNFITGRLKYGKLCKGQIFLNINLFIAKKPNELIDKKYDCIYYGRWRDDRKKYFKKYIQNGIYLSTSIKNMKKFKHHGCNPRYLKTISWGNKKETLNLFRYSLYIEDKYTHTVFNNLANRWY